jgi:uncharacterized protein (DUF433 family)
MPVRKIKPNGKLDLYALPNYGPIEAAEFLHAHPDTLRYWISAESGPLICPAQNNPPILSFKNLVECYVLDIIRRIHKISMPKVRFSVDTIRNLQAARHLMDSKYPLADHDLKIDDYKRLYVYDLQGKIVQLTKGGQIEWPDFVEACLRRVVRDTDGVARSFHPFLMRHDTFAESASDPELITVNPRVAFGKPVLKGTGITTETIAGRLTAGDTDRDLASEYGRTLEEIHAAAKFENVPIAA